MMSRSFGLSASLLMALVFSCFFWQEKLGLNLSLFTGLTLGLLWYQHPQARSSPRVWLTLLGAFFTGLMVVWHNSGTAKVIHLGAVLLAAGYLQQPQLRSVAFAMGHALGGYPRLLPNWQHVLKEFFASRPWLSRAQGYLKLLLIPLGVVGVFSLLFLGANPRLAAMGTQVLAWLGEWLQTWSWGQLGLFFLGLLLVSGLLMRLPSGAWLASEQGYRDQLTRRRGQHRKPFPLLALRRQYRMALLLMGLVNLLLLANNAVDIDWIWWNFTPEPGFDLTQFVHAGTSYLILSILLAMGIMLYFFRGNLNYLRHSRPLRLLAYLWIGQNAILAISVALRNYHYIAASGLAYKRIGVFFFLGLVLFGLFTLALKIRDRMSTYYLLRVNGWAVYAVAMALCLVNWDAQITRFNLTHAENPAQLDREFLLDMSAAALPELLTHQELFANGYDYRRETDYQTWLWQDLVRFQRQQSRYTWLSWNASDARVARFLEENPHLIRKLHEVQ